MYNKPNVASEKKIRERLWIFGCGCVLHCDNLGQGKQNRTVSESLRGSIRVVLGPH